MLYWHSLAGRLFKTVFGSYLALAIIVTVIQLIIEYSATQQLIGSDLSSLGKSFSGGVSGALWELDRPLLKTMALGIAQSSIVTGVRIVSDDGEEFAAVGSIPPAVSVQSPGIFAPYQSNVTLLTHQSPNGTRRLGTLTIISDSSVALERIKHSFIVILVNSIVKTAGLWIIFYLAITRGLSRPLFQLSDFVSQIRFASESENPVSLHYPHQDELGILTDSMNRMQERLVCAHRELDQLNHDLEQTVAERTASLSRALADADTANRAKSAFLATMSHEIRTPLNAIIGFSAVALKAELPPEQKEYLRSIQSSGELLLTTINDILDFSKIEAGRLTLEYLPFSLDRAVARLMPVIRHKTAEKGIELAVQLSPDIPRRLIGDEHRLSQVLVNLLGNASKFTEVGRIELAVSVLESDGDRVLLKFAVSDTGIGIPEDKREQLFQPFTQADDSITRRYGGTGLGLSICSRLVDLMGGAICCDSVPGKGSIFCFRAWFGIGEADAEADSADAANDQSGLVGCHYNARILLVEDNRLNQQLVMAMLKGTGLQIECAENGEEALRMLTRDTAPGYDLILMDIQMPVMDGYETTRLIRQNPDLVHIPIIAMTAHVLVEEQQQIASSGMVACVTKPLGEQTLLAVLARWLPQDGVGTEEQPFQQPARESEPYHRGEIPSISGLDTVAAVKRMGDPAFYRQFIALFLEGHTGATLRLASLIEQQDFASAARMAHTIKGDAGSIGSESLWDAAQALETVLMHNAGRPDEIQQRFKLFARELDNLMGELQKTTAYGP